MYPNQNHRVLYSSEGDADYPYSDIHVDIGGAIYFNNRESSFLRQNPSPTLPLQSTSYQRRSMDMGMSWVVGTSYRPSSSMSNSDPLYPSRNSSVRDEVTSPWVNPTTNSPSQWSMSDHSSYWDPLSAVASLADSEERKPDISQLDSQSTSLHSGASTPFSSSGMPMNSENTAKKSCSHCHATSTPLWRREPGTQRPLCNACGLYLQQRHKLRPQELIDADNDDGDGEEEEAIEGGPECSHCHTRTTSVWRRSKTGAQLCNACGVYARLRHKDRPLSLKKNKIKPRSKHPK